MITFSTFWKESTPWKHIITTLLFLAAAAGRLKFSGRAVMLLTVIGESIAPRRIAKKWRSPTHLKNPLNGGTKNRHSKPAPFNSLQTCQERIGRSFGRLSFGRFNEALTRDQSPRIEDITSFATAQYLRAGTRWLNSSHIQTSFYIIFQRYSPAAWSAEDFSNFILPTHPTTFDFCMCLCGIELCLYPRF